MKFEEHFARRPAGQPSQEDAAREVLELFDTTHDDDTAKHFREKLVDEFGIGFSYNWLRVKLQDEGCIRKARRPSALRARVHCIIVPPEDTQKRAVRMFPNPDASKCY